MAPLHLVRRVSDLAATELERLVPSPVRSVVDRTLIDAACASRGGVTEVAQRLRVDAPAVDAWRFLGVPAPFRPRLAAIIVAPELPRRPVVDQAA